SEPRPDSVPRPDEDTEDLRPDLVGPKSAQRAPGKVPLPSLRGPLPDDLEQELQAALAGTSMEELVGGGSASDLGEPPAIDSRYRAAVVKIHGDNVFFSLGGRHEGVASLRQFKEPPQVGTPLDVVVTRFKDDEGLYELTVPGASVSVHDWADVVEGTVVEARITGVNAGGLECLVGTLRGFIPASQISTYRVENLEEYCEQRLPCVVTEANERKRNLVLSHRAVLERQQEEARQKLLAELAVGQVREGVVRSIRDFGAFVDLGGLDGLIHISQLSWDRINHPSEVLQESQRVRVRIEKIDPETGRIGLSYRELLDRPWATVESQFPVGAMVKGVVSCTAKFGAFVKLAPGIEGLIHISELAHHRVVQVTHVVKEGEEVEVKILSVDLEAQRISLSLKAARPLPKSAASASEPDDADEPAPQPTVPRSNRPLQGGTSQSTGGDKFGLNW
ncbi:MAG: S1 RNA-binding domain-containing protein, partial [Planctomycetota bacterium]|nr:S1 RNA-binding domain-containing protein [Planctomycetota bacterium]